MNETQEKKQKEIRDGVNMSVDWEAADGHLQ